MNNNTNEQNTNRIVYACSGVANTGLLADLIARRWMKNGDARMSCLAAVGAADDDFITAAAGADENVVIDGCPKACGKRIFAAHRIAITHLKTTDFDVVKGETPINDELVARVGDRMREQIALAR